MASQPTLIIQLRRLGDLILTFPLLLALQKNRPGNTPFVVAKTEFFKGLLPFAPAATFFPASELPRLTKLSCDAVFNFGGSPLAANITAQIDSPLKFGEIRDKDQTHISGFWELYRAALTHNNRHNLFHWADLNRLNMLAEQAWPRHLLQKRPKTGRIGLFIGASEITKRPDAHFWSSLARRLLRKGLKPIILGGPAEKDEGAIIARESGLEKGNFCGKTELPQLAHILKSLDLLVTPDTGPMHLADWLGTPVLNLSMGNVNADETGPLTKGQIIVRADMSCVGCWGCNRAKLHCHRAFSPGKIETLIDYCLDNKNPVPQDLHGLEILRAELDSRGLRILKKLQPGKESAREALSLFWKQAFLHLYFNDEKSRQQFQTAAAHLAREHSPLFSTLQKQLARLPLPLLALIKTSKPLPDSFWQNQAPHSRFFAGWLHMRMQNDNFSRSAIAQALENIEELAKAAASVS